MFLIMLQIKESSKRDGNQLNEEKGQQVHIILQVHTNGTITIELKEGVSERLNI